MSITIHLFYTGVNGSARKFAEEMISSGTVQKIRKEKGNLGYRYYVSLEDPETVLLVDQWENQEALDLHHGSEMMGTIASLRNKYDLHMKVERFSSEDNPVKDDSFIRK